MAAGQGADDSSSHRALGANEGSESVAVETGEGKDVVARNGPHGGTNGAVGGDGGGEAGGIVLAEIKFQCSLAWPIIVANLLSYSFVLVSIMFVGHLGELELSSVSISNSVAMVSGFSVMVGLSMALETLCGQAYGAKRYHLLGLYLQSSIIVSFSFVFPILILWFNIKKILIALGQDPEIASMAASYIRYTMPGLFFSAFTLPLNKFLQTQSLVLPIMINALVTAILHPFVCYTLIYTLGFGYHGGAMTTSFSYIMLGFLNFTYILRSGKCRKCWDGFAVRDAFGAVGTYLSLAVPSVVMMCFEFWAFELLVLSSGLLPRPSVEVSLLSIALTLVNVTDTVPLGLSVAGSIRISNELGANKPEAAKLAMKVDLGLAIFDGCILSGSLMLLRNVWGLSYTNIPEVLDYVTEVTPFVALLILMDPISSVLSGVLRGSGRQALGASVNLIAYYVIGVPLGLFLGFRTHLNGKGLVLGIVIAMFVQMILLLSSTFCTSWEALAQKAQDRVLQAPSKHEPLLPDHS